MAHAGFHLSAVGLGKAQAVHDFQRHDGSDFFVTQKTDAPLVAALCRRLGDVVHQHRPNKCLTGVGRQLAEHEANVGEHIALWMIFRRLLTTEGGGQLRQHLGQ